MRCFIVWNYGFGRYFPYADFVEAMVYDYLIYGRRSAPYSIKVQETESRCVRFYINHEISHLRKVGYKAYREEFKKEHPEYFIDESCRVFRCLDMSLNREEKIAACHAHKRNLRTCIIDSFISRIMKNPGTLHSWFSEYVDGEGKNRTCFSDKAVESLNKRLKNNGLNTSKNITLYRLFRGRVKERFGCNIRTFFNNVLMSAFTEEVITKAIKKIKGKSMMSLYISALKKYRKICEVYYSNEDISFDDIFREYGIECAGRVLALYNNIRQCCVLSLHFYIFVEKEKEMNYIDILPQIRNNIFYVRIVMTDYDIENQMVIRIVARRNDGLYKTEVVQYPNEGTDYNGEIIVPMFGMAKSLVAQIVGVKINGTEVRVNSTEVEGADITARYDDSLTRMGW